MPLSDRKESAFCRSLRRLRASRCFFYFCRRNSSFFASCSCLCLSSSASGSTKVAVVAGSSTSGWVAENFWRSYGSDTGQIIFIELVLYSIIFTLPGNIHLKLSHTHFRTSKTLPTFDYKSASNAVLFRRLYRFVSILLGQVVEPIKRRNFVSSDKDCLAKLNCLVRTAGLMDLY